MEIRSVLLFGLSALAFLLFTTQPTLADCLARDEESAGTRVTNDCPLQQYHIYWCEQDPDSECSCSDPANTSKSTWAGHCQRVLEPEESIHVGHRNALLLFGDPLSDVVQPRNRREDDEASSCVCIAGGLPYCLDRSVDSNDCVRRISGGREISACGSSRFARIANEDGFQGCD